MGLAESLLLYHQASNHVQIKKGDIHNTVMNLEI